MVYYKMSTRLANPNLWLYLILSKQRGSCFAYTPTQSRRYFCRIVVVDTDAVAAAAVAVRRLGGRCCCCWPVAPHENQSNDNCQSETRSMYTLCVAHTTALMLCVIR